RRNLRVGETPCDQPQHFQFPCTERFDQRRGFSLLCLGQRQTFRAEGIQEFGNVFRRDSLGDGLSQHWQEQTAFFQEDANIAFSGSQDQRRFQGRNRLFHPPFLLIQSRQQGPNRQCAA